MDAKRRALLGLLKGADIFVVVLSFAMATILVIHADQRVPLSEFLSIRVKLGNCVIFALLLLIWHLSFLTSGLYQSKRMARRTQELGDVLKACLIGSFALAVLAAVLSVSMVTPRFILVFILIITPLMLAYRFALRTIAGWVRKRGRNLRNMLIIGTNSRAVEFARRIQSLPERGYSLVGFVDNDWPGLSQFKKTNFELLCNYDELPELLRRNVVDEIAMYLPFSLFPQVSSEVAALCKLHGIIMRLDLDIFGFEVAASEEIAGKHYLSTHMEEIWPRVAKRMVDILIASSLLLLLSPLMGIVAILIKFTMPGPVFFLQQRVGRNKRRFQIFKFRSMVTNAEELINDLQTLNEAKGPVFKIKEDPRVTPLGRFLRRTSIDELPQLLNVLKGDMSLVGPRPLPMRDYDGFSEDWQRRRFSVRPGITCLWQVNGRSSVTFDQWMKLDLKYLDEWSFWLDMKILAQTIPAVLRRTGAV